MYSHTQLVNFGSGREQKSEKIQVRSYAYGVCQCFMVSSYGSFGDHFYNEIINLKAHLEPSRLVEH